MIAMKAAAIAEVISGTYVGPDELVVQGGCGFDSREITPGDIFLALKGEKSDGHQFIADARARGAALAIVTQSVDMPHIVVADVLGAIAQLALHVRRELKNLKVVGITGSQGKTTTKDILKTVLSLDGETIVARGSYNNELGAPLTILNCTPTTRYCVVEMGARHTGDIAALVRIADPDVGAVLKVGTAHLGEFGSREKIAKTKAELIEGLRDGAIAVLGMYDEFTPRMADGLHRKVLTFGEDPKCAIRAADLEIRGGYSHFDLVTPEGREPVELRLLGAHQTANALAAAAIAFALGMKTAQIAAGLSSHESASRWRMELHELSGILLINDAYNANPESMEAALRTLALLTQERGGRSWAFLATMHELGAESSALHAKVGTIARDLHIDHLVAIGNKDLLPGGSDEVTHQHFLPSYLDATSLIDRLESGDVVLVKGSRAEHLEELAAMIIQKFGQSESGEKGRM